MSVLQYLKDSATALGYSVTTDQRQVRGVMIIPSSFQPVKVYGERVRVTVWRVALTLVGAAVGDGTAFDEVEKLAEKFQEDQTADSNAEAIEVSQWDIEELEKGLATFTTTVTVRET